MSRFREVFSSVAWERKKKTWCTMAHTSGHVASTKPSNEQSQLVLASAHLHRLSFMTHCNLRYTPAEGRLSSNVEAKNYLLLQEKPWNLRSLRAVDCDGVFAVLSNFDDVNLAACERNAMTDVIPLLLVEISTLWSSSTNWALEKWLIVDSVSTLLTCFRVSCTCKDCSCTSLVEHCSAVPT